MTAPPAVVVGLTTPFGTPTEAITDPSLDITAVRGDRMWGWTEQTRSEVLAHHGASRMLRQLRRSDDGGDVADSESSDHGLHRTQGARRPVRRCQPAWLGSRKPFRRC